MKSALLAFSFAAAVFIAGAAGDVVIENPRCRLVIGENGAAKSLVVKASGEECLDVREDLRAFAVVQDRPFNNEVKLAFSNKRTTYRADRVRREGDRLFVGFELISYEMELKITETKDYIQLELVDFPLGPRGANDLQMTYPPVDFARILELPVKDRSYFGDWLNVSWDDKAAVAVIAGEPYTWIENTKRHGFHLLTAEAHRDLKLAGTKAVLVTGCGREDFLDAMDGFEIAENLPRGVQSRRSKALNQSIYWVYDISPTNVEDHIARAKKGGFRNMLLYHVGLCDVPGGYQSIGDYRPNPSFPEGHKSIREMVERIKAAGIRPGFHFLQTFIGFDSHYVTPVADPRLNLKQHFTLAKPLGTGEEDIHVQENPFACPTNAQSRILAFGGELISYEGFTTERPYRFTGVKRGAKKTKVTEHPQGQIGGVLDVCEFGAISCYIDQRTDLQDEVAEKIAKIIDCGFEFLYNDGSEGVNVPQGIYVPLAQYRVLKKCAKAPLFTEGAAKGHWGWHFQSGANAFDTFKPEIFKEMIIRWPFYEAPIMAQDMTRLDFGWWSIVQPGEKTTGTQPDHWEFGTSKAASWDCPATAMFHNRVGRHPRLDDLMEVMRRWEVVRERGLPEEWRRMIRDPEREFHLVPKGDWFELVEWKQLEVAGSKSSKVRAFIYELDGRRTVVYWHISGKGEITLRSGKKLMAAEMKEYTSDMTAEELASEFAGATL